jgi:hypothetical protein
MRGGAPAIAYRQEIFKCINSLRILLYIIEAKPIVQSISTQPVVNRRRKVDGSSTPRSLALLEHDQFHGFDHVLFLKLNMCL